MDIKKPVKPNSQAFVISRSLEIRLIIAFYNEYND